MKTYRVHLTEMICGDVIVEAENLKEAQDKALHSPEVDWDSDSEVEVTNVIELDASGNEK
jgi:hypothetical protein